MTEMQLFVYGSLAEGHVHFHKISQYIVSRQKATVLGEVYRLPSGYPVLLSPLSPQDSDSVCGELVQIQAPDLFYRILDEYHGYNLLVPEKSLYKREELPVLTSAGETVQACAYLMLRAKLPKTAQRLPQGDWVTDLQNYPPMLNGLTERQASYIKRLSSSSGREIVPIDLDLYRELMKLDLIVDKGRRLALSKLGKEVARYMPEG